MRNFLQALIFFLVYLQVEPFASLAALPRVTVPRLLLNRELVGPFKHHRKRPTDVSWTGDLVEGVMELVRVSGWEGDLRNLEVEGDSEAKNYGLSDCSSANTSNQTNDKN